MEIDDVDRRILGVLRGNARMPVSEIARSVSLSPAPVARRIERLEQRGVIRGYTAIIDDQLSGNLEAFTEVRLEGSTESGTLESIVQAVPEVLECMTIAGNTDALVRFRAHDVDHLQRVVNSLRASGHVAGTRTHIVLHRWTRGQGQEAGPD
jgi:Lrp/AsnC family leucine-responsive transcriptional regulator